MAVAACRTLSSDAAEPPRVVPVDGKPFAAALVSADAVWQIGFLAGDRVQKIAATDLAAWGHFRDTAKGPLVLLADGGLLIADPLRADKDRLTIDGDLFGLEKVPLEILAGVVFRCPGSRGEGDRLLDRVWRAQGDKDLLILDNGDEVSGLFESLEDDTVAFRAEVGSLKVEIQRIVAILFNPSLRQAAVEGKGDALHGWVGFTDGSRLLASGLAIEGPKARISLAGKLTWTTATDRLAALRPLGPRVVYLGGMKPEGYRQIPFLDLAWPYTIDRNVTGGWLRCRGRTYLFGIGMHSAARLSYAVDPPAKRFEAEIGIDDSTSGGGSVRFRVFVDGRERFMSDTVRGGGGPTPVSVDLTGAKRLDLVIDYADRGDVLDRADWLDARLVR